MGLIPGLGRSLGIGNGNPLQFYCLRNPMEKSHRQRSPVAYSPWGRKELDTTAHMRVCAHTHTHTHIRARNALGALAALP